MTERMTAITPASFPTPHFALHTNDETEVARIREFAHEHVRAAMATLPPLADALRTAWSRQGRAAAFRAAYEAITRWRADLAHRTRRRVGVGLADEPDRYLLSIDEGGPNYDRLGYVGRLREKPFWHGESRTYRGGLATPALRITVRYGQVALDRFAAERHDGDTLRNLVTLPDGTTIVGNSLVRGAAARRVAADLVRRIARRGVDASRIETGGDPVYAVTAPDANRARLFEVAMTVLGDAAPHDVGAWQTARYLLYQAPLTKKGSDAVIRTFLVTAGTFLLDEPPVLEQDVDLRCIVAGQRAATVMPPRPRVSYEPARKPCRDGSALPDQSNIVRLSFGLPSPGDQPTPGSQPGSQSKKPAPREPGTAARTLRSSSK
ncbi:hypothetical protein CLV71_10184 [Actinophytocola oryzae]|uniref:Uncharacterized protein n=1 Tax=Actinophytocola oryzae TaxID=502181 RepID=A0A4R7W3I7_9PSEU|nr:hypothetical protein CLV71_10184 [Actinophytocola oryzae]